MRTKRVLRYYCDHCSKGGFKGPNIRRHEETCVHNPNRSCWACKEFELHPQLLEILVSLADAITPNGQNIGPLEKAADGCPACMLAAIVQSRSQEDIVWVTFDYKERMTALYADKCENFDR